MSAFGKVRRCLIPIPVLFAVSTVSAPAYEDIPDIALTDVVSPAEAQSVHHRIEEMAVQGNFFHFTVDSEFGIYRA